jgi:hypothetical protein
VLPLPVLVVLAFAAFRLTRMVTDDSLTHAFRGRLYRWAWNDAEPVEVTDENGAAVMVPSSRGPVRSYVYELLTCPWCLGVWVSALVYVLWRWADVLPIRAGLVILALAGAQGSIAYLASRKDG